MTERSSWKCLWAIVLCWLTTGPAAAADDVLVGRVDSEQITLGDLKQFRAESTKNFREPQESLEGWRFYLQTMIDMRLMVREALELGLDQTPDFRRAWERDRKQKLVNEYSSRTIIRELDLTVDDMRQSYEDSKWTRMLRLAHIRTSRLADAQRAMRDLEQGRSFAAVAQEHSIVPTTGAEGGVLPHWYGRGNLEEFGIPVEAAEVIFDHQVGEYTRPLAVGDHYDIYRILEEEPAPMHYRAAYLRAEYWRGFQERWPALADSLKARFEPRLDGDVIRLLVERMRLYGGRGLTMSSEDQQVVLVRYKGGSVTLGDFAETYNAYWLIRSISFDSTGISDFVQRDLLPRVLVFQAALEEGLEEDPEVAAWLHDKREFLLLEALRKNQVVDPVVTDSAEVRRYYDEHPERFMELEELRVSEILVASRDEAEELLREARAGADMDSLAWLHSLREEKEHGHLHMHNHPSERRVYGRLYDEVARAQVGRVGGPVRLEGGYSVFRLEERIPARPASFENAESRATWWVRKAHEKARLEALFTRLREKYAARVAVYEAPLHSLEPN